MDIREAETMAVNSLFKTDYGEFFAEYLRLHCEIISWSEGGNEKRNEILKTPESSHILGIYLIENAVLEWLDLMAAKAAQFLMTAMIEMGRQMANGKPEVTIH